MTSRPAPRRVLILAHANSVSPSLEAASALEPHSEFDLLPLGRAAPDLPHPEGLTLLAPPDLSGRPPIARFLAALDWTLRLRRRRYKRALVALLDLGVNQSRGAILGLAWALGVEDAIAIDPLSGRRTRPYGRRTLLVDAFRFVAFHAVGFGLAAPVSVFLRLVRPSLIPRGSLSSGSSRRAVYLRTDIEGRFTPLYAGGSLTHTQGILGALGRGGYDVDFLTTGELAGAAELARERRLPVILKGNVPRELCELLSGIRQGLARLPSRASPPAFVYQRLSMNNLAGVLMARRYRVPLILEANASEVQWREQWGSLRLPTLGRSCERLILGSAARITAVSENAARDLAEAGAPQARVRVVPNAADVERFARAEARVLPFSGDAFVIGFTGLFYPWHGVRYLAEAFPSILAARPSARLLLVGDGEDRPIVAEILDRAGVKDRVVFTGLVPPGDIPGYLRACDVLASPHAASDGFIGSPIKIWEYMAAGRAIIASDLAQMGDVLKDGRTALLVSQADPAALANGIVRLHDDPDLRTRLGAAAQAEAREKHSWNARLRQTLE